MLTKSVQSLLLEAQEEDVARVHPLRVECKYTVRGQGIITCMQPLLVAGGAGVGRSNLPQKSSVLSEPKFGPPNKKFLDPPLLLGHFQRKGSVRTREDCANSGIRAYDKNDENMKLEEIEHHRSWKMEKSLKVG